MIELDEIYDKVETMPLQELLRVFPQTMDYLQNHRLENLPGNMVFLEALEEADPTILEEFGLRAEECSDQLAEFLYAATRSDSGLPEITELTILGGTDKEGNSEKLRLSLHPGDVVSIVGPTGSGKSRLLEDIECLAQGDTPTGRTVLINGEQPDDALRMRYSGKLIAMLSQNMNFVIDLSVEDFLKLHCQVRGGAEQQTRIDDCIRTANALSGEPFPNTVKVTQLSGGQSRALMIADAAYISNAPIVLIDEIENAGVDRVQAVETLLSKGKLVLISTHDPLLALSAQKRIVLENGAVKAIITPDEAELAAIPQVREIDKILNEMRNRLRCGGRISTVET